VLGEKRSQSLFAPKASAEKAAATHITTGPDGRKKELPLYFGPDCPVSGNMGQNQHEAGVGEPQPADEPLRHAPADDGTGVEADPTDSVNMAEDLPRRSLNTESAGGYRVHSLFFTPENEGQDFNTVLQDVQEYISGKYSALITEGGDEDAKAQIKRYITKYVQDRRIAVKGYSGDQLVDALYTEMAEFGLLTKYIFGTGIEEINVNSWRDIEVLYANGETVKLEEHFDSPEHAVNVIRRMLHVSGMVLDNASPAVLGHLSKNIRIAVLKTPLVDEDVGVTASIRIVNPQNMQKEDFVKGGTATGPMLDFLAACLRYGVSVCVAGATGSGKTTVAGGRGEGKTRGGGRGGMDRIAAETLGDDFRTALAGDSKEFRESSSSLMFAFLLAILLIYLILAAQFESFKDPLVIMLTVPLAIAGALVFMAANGQTMNIFSQIGIIMLIGLVAKNGILIVEFANQKQEAGIDKLHAIEEASLQRLRPILMTSASTILGLLPLTVATGEGANGRIAMGIAVVGGMVVSTLLTLYIVPAIYSYVSTDRSKK